MLVQRKGGVELSGAARVLRNRIGGRTGGYAATRRDECARMRTTSLGALLGERCWGGGGRRRGEAALSQAVGSYTTTATATATATARSGTGTRWVAVSIAGTLRSLGVRCGE